MSSMKSACALAVFLLVLAISEAAITCGTACSPGRCPSPKPANCDGTFFGYDTFCGCCGYCVTNIRRGGGCVPITDGIPRATCASGTSCINFICQ